MSIAKTLRAALTLVTRYMGTSLAVFVAQFCVTTILWFVVANVLATEFGDMPMFDAAMRGDLAALVATWNWNPAALRVLPWMVIMALLLWQLVSQFLQGGLNGVWRHRPEGRRGTAYIFGASGAQTFLRYLSVSLLASLLYALGGFMLTVSLGYAGPYLARALTLTELGLAIALAIGPALAWWFFVATAGDIAKTLLTFEQAPNAMTAMGLGLRLALTRPRVWLWVGSHWLVFGGVTLGYILLAATHGSPTATTSLLLLRIIVALLRHGAKLIMLAGLPRILATKVQHET